MALTARMALAAKMARMALTVRLTVSPCIGGAAAIADHAIIPCRVVKAMRRCLQARARSRTNTVVPGTAGPAFWPAQMQNLFRASTS